MNTGVKNFPLALKCDKWVDYDDETALPCSKNLVRRLAEKLDWPALSETLASVSRHSYQHRLARLGGHQPTSRIHRSIA